MEKKRSATASGEDYLEAVLVLQKEKGMVRSVDVARHMGVSKPSVCHAVVTLKKGGFLTMDEDLFLRLTDIGREVAEQTYEKHCFFTRRLIAAGVDPQTAEREACRMEHTISHMARWVWVSACTCTVASRAACSSPFRTAALWASTWA